MASYDEGPQSFAPETPGTIPVDLGLVAIDAGIEKQLWDAAFFYEAMGDFRWFFAYSHAGITQRINASMRSAVANYEQPNAMLKFNIHFATAFLRAVGGLPSPPWEDAFRACKVLEDNQYNPMTIFIPEVEVCGAIMANVHISVDIANAINDIGCVPPRDFGNILCFVEQASSAALAKLRGAFIGNLETDINKAIPVVKYLRNSVYYNQCNASVPDPQPGWPR
jgi:hypothetical protein